VTKRAETADRHRMHTHQQYRQRDHEPLRRGDLSRTRGAARVCQSGVVLPIVLLISAMMLATSAVWFETSLAAARAATNVRDYLQAFHAADSALTLCARSVIAAGAEAAAPPVASGEPAQWKLQTAFDAGALTPVAQWPGSVRAPQCLIEAWRLATRADARAYLLTARGFGRTNEAQVWLQMELVIDGEAIERHWRRVAARPF
jgi:Tfp pilus assembly protein PilX